MLLPDKEAWIQDLAVQSRTSGKSEQILWSRHATAKLVDLSLLRTEVEKALEGCEIIEDYATLHRPLPDCLVLGFLPSGQPIHVVIAMDEDNKRLFIVTVYFPYPDRWHNDQRTRK